MSGGEGGENIPSTPDQQTEITEQQEAKRAFEGQTPQEKETDLMIKLHRVLEKYQGRGALAQVDQISAVQGADTQSLGKFLNRLDQNNDKQISNIELAYFRQAIQRNHDTLYSSLESVLGVMRAEEEDRTSLTTEMEGQKKEIIDMLQANEFEKAADKVQEIQNASLRPGTRQYKSEKHKYFVQMLRQMVQNDGRLRTESQKLDRNAYNFMSGVKTPPSTGGLSSMQILDRPLPTTTAELPRAIQESQDAMNKVGKAVDDSTQIMSRRLSYLQSEIQKNNRKIHRKGRGYEAAKARAPQLQAAVNTLRSNIQRVQNELSTAVRKIEARRKAIANRLILAVTANKTALAQSILAADNVRKTLEEQRRSLPASIRQKQTEALVNVRTRVDQIRNQLIEQKEAALTEVRNQAEKAKTAARESNTTKKEEKIKALNDRFSAQRTTVQTNLNNVLGDENSDQTQSMYKMFESQMNRQIQRQKEMNPNMTQTQEAQIRQTLKAIWKTRQHAVLTRNATAFLGQMKGNQDGLVSQILNNSELNEAQQLAQIDGWKEGQLSHIRSYFDGRINGVNQQAQEQSQMIASRFQSAQGIMIAGLDRQSKQLLERKTQTISMLSGRQVNLEKIQGKVGEGAKLHEQREKAVNSVKEAYDRANRQDAFNVSTERSWYDWILNDIPVVSGALDFGKELLVGVFTIGRGILCIGGYGLWKAFGQEPPAKWGDSLDTLIAVGKTFTSLRGIKNFFKALGRVDQYEAYEGDWDVMTVVRNLNTGIKTALDVVLMFAGVGAAKNALQGLKAATYVGRTGEILNVAGHIVKYGRISSYGARAAHTLGRATSWAIRLGEKGGRFNSFLSLSARGGIGLARIGVYTGTIAAVSITDLGKKLYHIPGHVLKLPTYLVRLGVGGAKLVGNVTGLRGAINAARITTGSRTLAFAKGLITQNIVSQTLIGGYNIYRDLKHLGAGAQAAGRSRFNLIAGFRYNRQMRRLQSLRKTDARLARYADEITALQTSDPQKALRLQKTLQRIQSRRLDLTDELGRIQRSLNKIRRRVRTSSPRITQNIDDVNNFINGVKQKKYLTLEEGNQLLSTLRHKKIIANMQQWRTVLKTFRKAGIRVSPRLRFGQTIGGTIERTGAAIRGVTGTIERTGAAIRGVTGTIGSGLNTLNDWRRAIRPTLGSLGTRTGQLLNSFTSNFQKLCKFSPSIANAPKATLFLAMNNLFQRVATEQLNPESGEFAAEVNNIMHQLEQEGQNAQVEIELANIENPVERQAATAATDLHRRNISLNHSYGYLSQTIQESGRQMSLMEKLGEFFTSVFVRKEGFNLKKLFDTLFRNRTEMREIDNPAYQQELQERTQAVVTMTNEMVDRRDRVRVTPASDASKLLAFLVPRNAEGPADRENDRVHFVNREHFRHINMTEVSTDANNTRVTINNTQYELTGVQNNKIQCKLSPNGPVEILENVLRLKEAQARPKKFFIDPEKITFCDSSDTNQHVMVNLPSPPLRNEIFNTSFSQREPNVTRTNNILFFGPRSIAYTAAIQDNTLRLTRMGAEVQSTTPAAPAPVPASGFQNEYILRP